MAYDRSYIIGETPDIRRRRLVREDAQTNQQRPGESFEAFDRRTRLASGQIEAGSVDALSEQDRLRLAALRTDIVNGVAVHIPSDLRQHVNDLLGESPKIRAEAREKTSQGILATVEALASSKGIDAAQVTEWSRDHAAKLAAQPLSRELRGTLGGMVGKVRSEHLNERMLRLNFSTATRLACTMEAAAKGVLLDEAAPEGMQLSDDCQAVLAGEKLPLFHKDFLTKAYGMGYTPTQAAGMLLECGGRICYGDRAATYTPTRTVAAGAKGKALSGTIEASHGGRAAYDATSFEC